MRRRPMQRLVLARTAVFRWCWQFGTACVFGPAPFTHSPETEQQPLFLAKEWDVPTPHTYAYDVFLDHRDELWAGSNHGASIVKLGVLD